MGCCESSPVEDTANYTPIQMMAYNLKNALNAGNDAEIIAIFTGQRGDLVGTMDIRTWVQTQLVPTYAQLYGHNNLSKLRDDVDAKISGNYRKAVKAFMAADADNLSNMLRSAMKGIGTDEFALIATCCTLPSSFVPYVREAYAKTFQRDLLGDIENEISGNFKRALKMQACFTRGEAYAEVMYKAIKGLGTDEKSLIRILTTATHEEVKEMNEAFQRKYGLLQQWIANDTSGSFKNVLLALSNRTTVESHDPEADADTLYNACKGIGTDEEGIISVLGNKTDSQIAAIAEAYRKKYRQDLKDRLRKETKGLFESSNFREVLMGLCEPRITTRVQYLREAMKGWGTDEWGLIMLLVHRSPAEREAIRREYSNIFHRDLVQDLKSETSGDFEDALVALVVPIEDTIARAINKSMGLFSTSNDTLISMLVASTAIMNKVRESYYRQFQTSLLEDLKKQLHGDYEDFMVAVANYTPHQFELVV